MSNSKCICEGNWRNIIKESDPLLGKKFFDSYTKRVYKFVGVVWAEDDYYYLMRDQESPNPKYVWSTCCVSLETAGYTLVEE